jgi:hypothetical protein
MLVRARGIRRGICNYSAVRYYRSRRLDFDADEKSKGEQNHEDARTLAEDEVHKSFDRQ